MTNPQQLADDIAKVMELDEKRPMLDLDLDTSQIHERGYFECPACDGQGEVEGEQYINIGAYALNVMFSGIGEEWMAAKNFYTQAPLMADIIRRQQEVMKEAARLIGFMTNEKIAEAAALLRFAAPLLKEKNHDN